MVVHLISPITASTHKIANFDTTGVFGISLSHEHLYRIPNDTFKIIRF